MSGLPREEVEASSDRSGDRPGWPYASLLLFGFFGVDTPEGRRLAWETSAGLALLLVAAVALRSDPAFPLPELLWVVALPAGPVVIGWAYARYLAKLDELGRMIQLRAFAFSYGAVLTLAAAMIAVLLADPSLGEAVAPSTFLAWLVAAELFRGLALVVLARTYR